MYAKTGFFRSVPINRWHKYAEWRRRKNEETKKMTEEEKERGRKKTLAGKKRIDTGQRYVHRIENRVIHHV